MDPGICLGGVGRSAAADRVTGTAARPSRGVEGHRRRSDRHGDEQASGQAAGPLPVRAGAVGLVANRALAPSSKRAAVDWINNDVHIDGLPEVTDDVCNRAMDWLPNVGEHLEREVLHQVADLLNLEVDLLFFDTNRRPPPDRDAARRDRRRTELAGIAGQVNKSAARPWRRGGTDRPGLRALLGYVRDGDVIVVHTLDRLGRTVRDTLNPPISSGTKDLYK
jgi:hypothetical protein